MRLAGFAMALIVCAALAGCGGNGGTTDTGMTACQGSDEHANPPPRR